MGNKAKSTMQLTFGQTRMLFFDLRVGDENQGFKVVDKGDWVDEGKYQYKDIVFEYDNKYWKFTVDRNGSYFSDYFYGFEECDVGEVAHQVEKVEVVKIEWRAL